MNTSSIYITDYVSLKYIQMMNYRHVRGKECTGMSLPSSFGDGDINMGNKMYEEFKTVLQQIVFN